MTKVQLDYLRLLGIVEGLSLIFLLFIAMPMRAATHNPSIVRGAGSAHGVLFLMFIYTLIDAASTYKWPKRTLLTGLAMSCLPFGTFWFDRKVLRQAQAINVASTLEGRSAAAIEIIKKKSQ